MPNLHLVSCAVSSTYLAFIYSPRNRNLHKHQQFFVGDVQCIDPTEIVTGLPKIRASSINEFWDTILVIYPGVCNWSSSRWWCTEKLTKVIIAVRDINAQAFLLRIAYSVFSSAYLIDIVTYCLHVIPHRLLRERMLEFWCIEACKIPLPEPYPSWTYLHRSQMGNMAIVVEFYLILPSFYPNMRIYIQS